MQKTQLPVHTIGHSSMPTIFSTNLPGAIPAQLARPSQGFAEGDGFRLGDTGSVLQTGLPAKPRQ
jgi:hypothetical protein